MSIRFIDEVEEEGAWARVRVVARFDLNVPIHSNGEIADTTRLDASLPTIRYLLEHGVSKLVLMGHLGRPNGQVEESLSMRPVGSYLAEQLGEEVVLSTDCINEGIPSLLNISQTKIVLLENLRFHPQETHNEIEFARTLAHYGEAYVNDAFGSCHRRHASVYGINAFFKKCNWGGLLLKREIASLSRLLGRPPAPFVAVMGGAKVSDKITAIRALLPKVERLLVGGAMAYPLLQAKGYEIGRSLCAPEDKELARTLIDGDKHQKIVLPVDHLASEHPDGAPVLVSQASLPAPLMGLDIGPQTLALYQTHLQSAQTVLWNGPVGMFENESYSKGTMEIARCLARIPGYTVVGGGDSVRAVKQSGVADEIDHISTGGGAALAFIEHSGMLPGLQALKFGLEL